MTYSISILDWESRFFGFPIGGLELPADYSPEQLEKSLQFGRKRFRLICITLEKFGPDLIATSDVPCVCYDRKYIFKKKISENVMPLDSHVKAYTSSFCSKWLERLAIQSGALTRFKRDPELSTQYERLFMTWINYSVSGELVDSIWTWREGNRHLGLVTVRNAKRINPENGQLEREARIGMLAVDEQHRNRGIGSRLFDACDFWCSSLSIPYAAIAVPADNPNVIALTEKHNFKKTKAESIYHYWAPGWVYDVHRGWMRLRANVAQNIK